jgi:hypothetical protein
MALYAPGVWALLAMGMVLTTRDEPTARIIESAPGRDDLGSRLLRGLRGPSSINDRRLRRQLR